MAQWVDMWAASPDDWSSISLDLNDKREPTDPESCFLTFLGTACTWCIYMHVDKTHIKVKTF